MTRWLHPGWATASSGQSDLSGFESAGGAAVCRRPSELPANGVGPPPSVPWRLHKAGIVPGSLCLLIPADAQPTGLPLSSPSSWPGWQETPGLLTHLLRIASRALGKEAHLGLCHPLWGISTCSSSPLPVHPPSSPRLQHTLHRPLNPALSKGTLKAARAQAAASFPPLPQVTGQHLGWVRPP